MPLIFETAGRFPFRTLRLLGWTLITLGVILLVLDITDVAYTVANFENNCDTEDTLDYIGDGWEETPCKNDDHIYAYIATGIWSSLVVIITGIIGARFSKWNIRHLRFQRDLYGLMAALCAVLFIPAVITLHALELKTLKDMGAFYYEDGDLKTRDEAKFAVPMVIIMIAGLLFIVCVITLVIACCCAPVSDADETVFSTTNSPPQFEFIRGPGENGLQPTASVRTHPVNDQKKRRRRPGRKRDRKMTSHPHNGHPGPYTHAQPPGPGYIVQPEFAAAPGHPAYPGSRPSPHPPSAQPNFSQTSFAQARSGFAAPSGHPGHPGQRPPPTQPVYPWPGNQRVYLAPASSVYGGANSNSQSGRGSVYIPRQAPVRPSSGQRRGTPSWPPSGPQDFSAPAAARPPSPPPESEYAYIDPPAVAHQTPSVGRASTILTPEGPSYYMGAVFHHPGADSDNQFVPGVSGQGGPSVTHVYDSTA